MKDIRIVTVSWNVEELLERCLRSLPAACQELEWDIVIVDNNSKDGSVDRARKVADAIGITPRVTVIANPDNRGFARACNQGIAGHDARYVLLLNPDAECPPSSLSELVRSADARPDAGIVGPKLIYPNGNYQESVRCFPTVWSQLCILLRLHLIAGWLPALRRYFCADLDATKEQNVDQVMGACFLIRREMIEQIGGLDERYFIWFEEVDYCKMAIERGWKVVYAPAATVIHHGGQSFGQLFSVKKQRMFNESLGKYFQKWMPGWRSVLIRLAMPFSMAIAQAIDALRTGAQGWLLWLVALIALDTLSLATVFFPSARSIGTVVLGILMAVLASRKPSLGLAALLLELMVGSKGALLKITEGSAVDGGTSLRIVLLAAFIGGWLFNAIQYWFGKRAQILKTLREAIRGRWAWVALVLVVLWGVIRGLQLHNPQFADDANAWGFLVLLVPVIDLARRDGDRLIRYGKAAAMAALVWLPIKTVLLIYVFSHGIPSLSQPLYLWVRRTGVGEVTLVTGNLFRIFIQSQIYAVFAWLAFCSLAMVKARREIPRVWWAIGIGSAISLLVCLSRSFWIGLAAGGLFLVAISARMLLKAFGMWLGRVLIAMSLALAIILITVAFPLPRVDVGSLKDLFGSRGSTTDAAAESRWNLLPVLISKIKTQPILGSGFGATVTYKSKDPRILAKNPEGLYTTPAFEWGWLEHWVKFGIIGIPVMLWLLLSIAWRVWKLNEERWVRVAIVSSIVALAVVHIFTPYLNHPLGFTVLLVLEAFIAHRPDVS
ncbi:MAG: glycosyltransferase [Patescibacteria group bacterium]